jgi:RimJ/RimL family protein N-acetyltransferase
VTAEADPANAASRRVMEKAGLTLVRTFRRSGRDGSDGEETDAVEYALTKADWLRQTDVSP